MEIDWRGAVPSEDGQSHTKFTTRLLYTPLLSICNTSTGCRVIRVLLHAAELRFVLEARGLWRKQNRAEHHFLCSQQESAHFMSIIRWNHVLEPKKVGIIQICQVGVGVKLLTQVVDPFSFCVNTLKLYALIGLIFYNEHFVSNSKTKEPHSHTHSFRDPRSTRIWLHGGP